MASQKAGDRLAVQKTYKLFIGGKFPRSESGRFFPLADKEGRAVANLCRASRKDFRECVVQARAALPAWRSASAYLRGQILYRVAEMLEGRADQFVTELKIQGSTSAQARADVEATIDRLVYYAGWSDKYQQVFSTVNPVASAHFNFSVPEPVGVVGVIAPEKSGLLGLVANLAPALIGGNSVIVLAPELQPLSAISLAEVLHAADVFPGTVNVLTGYRSELVPQFVSHLDVDALVFSDVEAEHLQSMAELPNDNFKRLINRAGTNWRHRNAKDPYWISDTQEIKTTWHPIGA